MARIKTLKGPVYTPQSSWVQEFSLISVNGKEALAVEFKGGFDAYYPNTDIRDFNSLKRASSKGHWLHTHIDLSNYREF